MKNFLRVNLKLTKRQNRYINNSVAKVRGNGVNITCGKFISKLMTVAMNRNISVTNIRSEKDVERAYLEAFKEDK